MLIQFALLVFALMGLAALVIDVGLLRVTQQRMQAAADTAALEALRGGRVAARDFAALAFSHDCEAPLPDPNNRGAGPVYTINGGVTSLDANGSIDLPPPGARSYKPCLELNSANVPGGDIETAPGGAYTVRLRRSGEEPVPGVLSSGGTIPLLFGRSSSIQGGEGPYSVRRDGFTVRAESTTAFRPALRVSGALLGPLPFAVSSAVWAAGAASLPLTGAESFAMEFAPFLRFGDEVVPVFPGLAPDPDRVVVVAVFETVSGVRRVAGFGAATLQWSVPFSSVLLQPVVESFPVQQGASVTLSADSAVYAQGPLWQAHRLFRGSRGVVLAPALIR